MSMSRTEYQKRSDDKRGIKLKAFKLPVAVIAEIEQLSRELGIPQNQLIVQMLEQFKQTRGRG